MSTPGMKTAAAMIALRFENAWISSSQTGAPQHRAAARRATCCPRRGAGRRRGRSPRPGSPRRAAPARDPSRARRARSRPRSRRRSERRAREAARSSSSSGAPIQTRIAASSKRPSTTAAGVPAGAQLARQQRHELAGACDRERPRIARTATQLAHERDHRQRRRASASASSCAPPSRTPEVDRLQDPDRQEVRDHRRAADRDERQRNAR